MLARPAEPDGPRRSASSSPATAAPTGSVVPLEPEPADTGAARTGVIPSNLHFKSPNPALKIENMPVTLCPLHNI